MLVALPVGVVTLTWPEPLRETAAVMLVDVEDETAAELPPTFTLLSVRVNSKFVPVMLMLSPAAPTAGVKLEIVGGPPLPSVTEKFVALVAEPLGEVTVTGPVVALVGTVVTIRVAVADVTMAATPLKVTVF
jgi:hypothetical protein